ncbi:recombination protein NinB [Chryseobacterium sp.]|uniref:recombination protein NinB n=1 Tax=Chryseobacterium sp. TaxID=1871047 RepID=UPI00321B6AFE
MSGRLVIKLIDPEQGHFAILTAWRETIKPLLQEGKRVQLEMSEEIREERHSKHFHSLIGQISDHIGGDLADREDAKRILISAFRIDTVNDVEFRDAWVKFGQLRMGSGLRGEVVMLGTQSKRFSNKLARGFIEWLYAFGAEHGVAFKAYGDQE